MARRILQGEPEDSATGSLAHDLERWDGVMDEIRNAMVALTAEHDRLQIAHDKLRERLDVHSLRPRGVVAAKAPPKAAATSGPHVLSSGQSQDFTAIDAELSKLNESMMRAMSE